MTHTLRETLAHKLSMVEADLQSANEQWRQDSVRFDENPDDEQLGLLADDSYQNWVYHKAWWRGFKQALTIVDAFANRTPDSTNQRPETP